MGSPVSAVDFSPDGKLLVSCSLSISDNINIWSMNSGEHLHVLEEFGTGIYGVRIQLLSLRLPLKPQHRTAMGGAAIV